ncbi:MAG: hypothetical protein GY821_14645 [Gammaproteobacteria bacterium]|nr:hypothetical protein [Gammaproteobacteria bacterium]
MTVLLEHSNQAAQNALSLTEKAIFTYHFYKITAQKETMTILKVARS